MVLAAWLLLALSAPLRAWRIRRLVFLPGDPLANVCRAILQADARPFTASEEVDGLAVDQPHVLEVERDELGRSVLVDQSLQLGKVFAFDATAEHNRHIAG